MRDDISRVRQYELMAIFSPEVPEEDLQGQIDRVGEIVGQAGGTVTLINRESPWGRRRLSYPIRHNSRDVRDGYYVLYYADIDTQSVTEIERDLKLTTSLMRYLITQQVAEQMIPESMKPDDESIAGITADGEPAAPVTVPETDAAPEATESPAEAPADEASTDEASTDQAPVAVEVSEEAPEADAAQATETSEESTDASGEDTGN
ncbi:MAG: 30S ribosomal protein S6 [Thermomicrobiales bacterium]|nr:30S ribosomal protein S6 [Thermomicrobiales bacterium]